MLPALASAQWGHREDSLARATETRFALPHGVCHAFSRQESSDRASAVRVETGYFNVGSRYYLGIVRDASDFADKYGVDEITERAYRSISFTRFQLMGQNLRAMGYNEPIMPLIARNDSAQFEYFGKFLSGLFKRYKTLARVASAYNTGNPNKTYRPYVKHILAYRKLYAY